MKKNLREKKTKENFEKVNGNKKNTATRNFSLNSLPSFSLFKKKRTIKTQSVVVYVYNYRYMYYAHV